ncbi:hypothetical protein GCM10009864_47990 [Streptomyces lunalinharesii]|uniref:Uncharacterized protein n=1 Tax=Streptomyces lunalinharesii TaxID=333384 RepID=A0ABP6EP71_9ACTN
MRGGPARPALTPAPSGEGIRGWPGVVRATGGCPLRVPACRIPLAFPRVPRFNLGTLGKREGAWCGPD